MSFTSSRAKAYDRQQGRCYYCQQPMWMGQSAWFADRYSLSVAQTHNLQATGEHLIPQEDGGTNTQENIVASCRYCNLHRHKRRPAPSPNSHALRARLRLANGKWHQLRLS